MLTDAQKREANRNWNRSGALRCRSCKTPVVFAKNDKTGNVQIVDAIPDPVDGNIFLSGFESKDGPQATVWNKDEAGANRSAGVSFHVDHHATCPEAEEWRQRAAAK